MSTSQTEEISTLSLKESFIQEQAFNEAAHQDSAPTSPFMDPMDNSTMSNVIENQIAEAELVETNQKKPLIETVSPSNQLVEKLDSIIYESKDIILDMIQEIHDLRREQELAKYESLCAKDVERSTSSAEMDIVSTLVKKNEQEREKVEKHYLERIKELSSERDFLLKESLDSKLKYQAQQTTFEQIKRRNIELECNFTLLQEQNKKLIANLSSTQSSKERFELLYRKVTSELAMVNERVQHFETLVFDTDTRVGLTESEARRRLDTIGTNELKEEEEESLFSKFIEKFKEPMILLLLGSAAISLLLGQYDDAISISLAVFIVCTVAFIQEWRSDKALESLKELTTHKATVIRDGIPQIIPASDIVPGDVVTFSSGDRVPADVRLVEISRLGIDESVFTGEVNPASKTIDKSDLTFHDQGSTSASHFPKATHVSDCKNIAFMGTLVSVGNGKGVVISTGQNTEIGKISDLLKSIEEKNTPLQDAMDDLSQKISYLSFGVIGVIFLIGGLTGKPWLEMFQMGISLAVAAIPEGLPIVVTVTLAMGVIRMSKKKAIVRKLPSVESLGACNVVCVDKTGTLTKNEMTLVKAFTLAEQESVINVTGLGYQANEGSFYKAPIASLKSKYDNSIGESIKPVDVAYLNTLLKVGVICNNANVDFSTNKIVGQPTEAALITAAQKGGVDVSEIRSSHKKIEEIPFSSEHKWMAIKSKNIETGKDLFYVKGAIENLLGNCTHYCVGTEYQKRPLTDQLRKEIENTSYAFAENALRVMTLCVGEKPSSDLTFVGIVGIYDPPRPGVKEAVSILNKGGVKVVMITGDSMKTAVAIAKELNIVPEDGDEREYALSVDDLTTSDFEDKIYKARVFYRMAPVHKMKIVSAYQKAEYIVAMTGDGINDAPALKMANIGIAMGKSGTDVSKEASEMILADDNFPTILSAIEEGKGIFRNIKSFLRYQLTTSISCMFIIIFCTFMGYPLPLNPMQILFINIIMDGPPAQSLGVEPVDDDVMNQPPRDTKKPITSGKIIMSIALSALIMVIGTLYVFISEMSREGFVTAHTTSITFTTFVFFQIFNAFNCRSEKKSVFQVGIFSNIPLILSVGGCALGQLAMLYVPFMRSIFETEPLPLSELFYVICVSSSVWVIEEVIKFFERRVESKYQSY